MRLKNEGCTVAITQLLVYYSLFTYLNIQSSFDNGSVEGEGILSLEHFKFDFTKILFNIIHPQALWLERQVENITYV